MRMLTGLAWSEHRWYDIISNPSLFLELEQFLSKERNHWFLNCVNHFQVAIFAVFDKNLPQYLPVSSTLEISENLYPGKICGRFEKNPEFCKNATRFSEYTNVGFFWKLASTFSLRLFCLLDFQRYFALNSNCVKCTKMNVEIVRCQTVKSEREKERNTNSKTKWY